MDDIAQLAKLAGIWSSFKDVWQNDRAVSEATMRSLLKALGFPADTPEETERSAKHLHSYRETLFPSVRVIRAHHRVKLAAPHVTAWELKAEDNTLQSGEAMRGAIILPPLAPGYYDLSVKGSTGDATCFLIVPPAVCWQPENLEKGKRVWGVSLQLYSVMSDKNCGMGDLGDLAALAKLFAERKADIIGLNPLHALFPSEGRRYAPYDPSSRLFLNVLYIDINGIDGFSACEEAKKIWEDASFQEKLSRARGSELVDYPLVSEIKHALLQPLYAHFKTHGRHDVYERFCAEEGERLECHAVFDALCAYFQERSGTPQSWHEWPEAYRAPASPEIVAFAAENAESVAFYKWLQWIADSQLARAQGIALQGGMEIGLCRDLAVGAGGAGAERWCDPAGFISGAHIGAPPDEYNPKGQDWGLCAFNPFRLRESRYASYIALLRNNMRHCRALRIDHAFGLSRLYLIPDGKSATEGTYVDFSFEEMLAILKLESHRHQCMVIGEDLGTFPPNYRDAAVKAGLLSYKVMIFEHEDNGTFRRPEYYDPQSLATFSTHDLPTLAGWLKDNDIAEKQRCGVYPSEELLNRDRHVRERDRIALDEILAGTPADKELRLAAKVQLFLAATPCAIVMAQMEDLLGVVPQVNLPTTTTERPNWRMKLPSSLKAIEADDDLKNLGEYMWAIRSKPLVDYPRATYRIQLHKDFTFHDAAKIVPYLAELGISHVYASPYLQARSGSKHGYDITSYEKINPELGGDEGYKNFCETLRKHGLKQLLDFVPNHMGVGGADNDWWLSVLEWGRQSPYASYFDIIWELHRPGDVPKIVLPFLADHYGDVLDCGDLKLAFDENEGSFSVWYHRHRFDICPRDYAFICESIPAAATYDDGQKLKAELVHNQGWRGAIAERVDAINRDSQLMHELLERQHYRLAFWRVASNDINFRRFFDINDLAGVRVEDKNLFNAMHGFVFSLIRSGEISGLRIDHIDGLADPAAYCHALRRKAGASFYLVVEKILGAGEKMPKNWGIQGTSGYDALNLIGGAFVDTRGEKALDGIYRAFTGMAGTWEEKAYDAKGLVLDTLMSSELQTLTLMLKRIAENSPYARDYPFDTLKQALKEIIGWFPVYRTYLTPDTVDERDVRIINSAVNRAKKLSWLADRSVYDFIAALLTLEDEVPAPAVIAFVQKFQQSSGPIMAKGVEDTAFYRFNRLLSLNEVGGSPVRFGVPIDRFHQTVKARCEEMPYSMLTTATHDTKRGEDMRMRLHVLSERPLLWKQNLTRWAQFNRTCRIEDNNTVIPSPNDEYFLYQTLLGSWPNELMEASPDPAALRRYQKRLEEYLIKTLRESKLHSDWNNPDTVYEEGVIRFLQQILDPERMNPFLGDIMSVARCLAPFGMLNSLAQTALKLTLPGVPDIYQGCELWDYSLVDPDNRRAVDYAARSGFLQHNEPISALLRHWEDGRVKQSLIHKLLQHREVSSDLYDFGDYEPLEAVGEYARHVLAFKRSRGRGELIVAVPVLLAGKIRKDLSFPRDFYPDTRLEMPAGVYRNILTGENVKIENNILHLAHDFPIIVLATNP